MKNLVFMLFLLVTQMISAQVTFDADFESGNLKSVSTTDSTTFNVYTHEDIQGRWFYFRISGVKDKFIKVVLKTAPADFTKAMYSYNDKDYVRFDESESPDVGTFQKEFAQDTVFVAYYSPYTYSMLQNKLTEWGNNSFVKIDTLGFTKNLFPIQELTVTDPSVPETEKLSVWIHARTHPGETPSSWQFEGIVKELLSGDEVINYYLSKIKFHLIPFTNPDGVYYGNSRTNEDLVDIERDWNKDDNETCLEVRALKTRMKELNDEKPFSVFLNLHSQASSYCTFWIHKAGTTSENFYTREHQFANLNLSDNLYFVKSDLRESDLQPYFPEGWLWNNYGDQVMALTYETPYNNYFRYENEEYFEVTNENLYEIGQRTVYAIAEYLELSHPKRYIMDNKSAMFAGESPTIYSVSNEYYGDDFAALESNTVSNAVFESENLPSGHYDVAGWWPTSEANSFETVFEITSGANYYEDTKTQKTNGGQWNYLTTVALNSEGKISIKMSSNSSGLVVADAFRLIYTGPITDIKEDNVPLTFVLYQNYPNPFNPATTIRYSVPNNHDFSFSNVVSLNVYDILGKKVITLVNEEQFAGEYEVTFNSRSLNKNLASGTYFYRLQIGDNVQIKKMMLMK